MNTLPDDIWDRIMRFNSHPCADMMNGLFQPWRDVLEIQRKSPDPWFRNAPQPSFFEWKVHGIGCEQWLTVFAHRADTQRNTCILDRLGNRRLDRALTLWENERDQLQLFEYHF